MTMQIQTSILFGTPLIRARLPEFFQREEEIREQILALQRTSSGVVRSNRRGWHSSEDLNHSENENIRWLVAALTDTSKECIARVNNASDVQVVSLWANISNDGSWNMPHVHLPAQWSGVFYVASGESQKTGDTQNGTILFFDPVPLGSHFGRPLTLAVMPETGTLLLFPCYLVHMVTPYCGMAPRISVAFNLAVHSAAAVPQATGAQHD